VLAVVQYKQQLPLLHPCHKRVDDWSTGLLANAEYGGDQLGYQSLIGHWRQLDQPYAVAERAHEIRRNMQCEAGFAAAADARQRDQAPRRVEYCLSHRRGVLFAPDQTRAGRRQVVELRPAPRHGMVPAAQPTTVGGGCLAGSRNWQPHGSSAEPKQQLNLPPKKSWPPVL
jgi:hypothetical protein